MATVVQLSEFRRDVRRSDPPASGSATIHLFLGVRYERHEETAPRAPERKGGGRRPRKRA